MTDTTRRKALVLMVLLSLVWSFNWIVMKLVLRDSGPFEFAALRGVLATGVLFAVLLLRRVPLAPPPLGPVLLVGLAQTLGFQALVQWALVEGGAGQTALLAYTMPFWVVGVAWVVLGERPARAQLFTIALALIGLLLVLEPWHGLGAPQSVVLAIGGGLCWAIGTVLSKRMFVRGQAGVLSLTAWQMLFGSIGLVIVSACVPEKPIAWTPTFIAALAYNAVLASGLAWAVWAWVVERLPTQVAGLSSLVIPIMGVLFAWALLGEVPSLAEACGIALVAVALLLVATRSKPRAAQST
jgi:drug/metabolite transporter (DMT)-like permease